ncbi:MAG: hypothetical protein RSF67_02945 [Clostridia bacterium]
MQKKYHLFKRSLIVNWINENKDDKYISNNVSDINIQMLEDYNIKNNLIKFNIDNVYYELTKSKDNNFYIFYDEIDSTKMLLDELERTINKIGVEKYIDDLFAFYKDREIKYEDISNYYNIFKILEF